MPEASSLGDKRVVVRVDWNMPVTDGVITDTSRFDVSVPFIKDLSFAGAKIIILTHFISPFVLTRFNRNTQIVLVTNIFLVYHFYY